MPFKSKAQARYFFANRKKLEKEGVDVQEWSDKTDYSKLSSSKLMVAADVLGLGVLAEPTVHKLLGGEVSERERDIAELGGLGILAGTQIPHLLAKSAAPISPITITGKTTVSHGNDVQQPLLTNPYIPGDAEGAKEYENGYQHAMGLGHQGISSYNLTDNNPIPWRQGFALGAERLGRKDISALVKTGGAMDVPKRLFGSLKMLGCKKNCINGSRKIMDKIPGSSTQIVGPGVHAIVTTPSGARLHYGKAKDGTTGFMRIPDSFQPRWQMGEKLEDLRLGVRKKACYDPSLMTVNSAPRASPLSPGILFDIDGTLVSEENGEIFPGVLNKLLALHAQGMKMAAVTNRSVWDDVTSVDDVYEGIAEILTLCGGTLRDGYYVSHGPSPLHKPAPDMLLYAMQRECIDPAHCVYVGNCDTDNQAAEAAGIPFIHVDSFFSGDNYGLSRIP